MEYLYSNDPSYSSSLVSIFQDLDVEPVYNPASPSTYDENDIDLSEIPLSFKVKRGDKKHRSYSAKNINDYEFDRDHDLAEAERTVKPFRSNEKKKKRKKADEAEALFDFNAKPKDLKEFFAEVKNEIFLEEIDLTKKNNLTIETVEQIEDPVIHEEMAMMNLVVAKHNSTNQLDKDYGLGLIFNDEIESTYIRNLNLDPEQYDLSDIRVRYPYIDVYNQELFIQRRLFSCLSHLQFSDPEFLKKHLPVHVDLSKVDESKLVNDDPNSLSALKNFFQHQFENCTTTSKVFNHGNIKLKELEKCLQLKKFRRLQNYLIIMFVLFKDPGKLENRSIKVKNLNPVFRQSIFKHSDLKTCFNAVGIGFFDDFLSFNIIKRYIANLTEDRHKKRMKELKLEISEAKKRKKIADSACSDCITN